MRIDQKLSRNRFQTSQYVLGVVGIATGHRRHRSSAFTGDSRRQNGPPAYRRPALEYGFVEQALAHRRQQVKTHAGAPASFAEYRHAARVAVEPADVVLYPAQGLHLILHAVVAGKHFVLGAQKPYARSARRSWHEINNLIKTPAGMLKLA